MERFQTKYRSLSLKNLIMATVCWGQRLQCEDGCSSHHSPLFYSRWGQKLCILLSCLCSAIFLATGTYCFIHLYYLLNPCGHLCLHQGQTWHVHFLCLVFKYFSMPNLSASLNIDRVKDALQWYMHFKEGETNLSD